MSNTREKIQTALQPHLRGEPLLHCAYGVDPIGMLTLILLAVVTAGVGAFIASQTMNKNYFIGVTPTRLILVKVGGLSFKPESAREVSLNDVRDVEVSSGAIFAVLRFSEPQGPMRLKFHRAAFSGNHDGAHGIADGLTKGASPSAGAFTARLEPNSEILVRWSDGNEYPARVIGATDDQVHCSFPNGQAAWVGKGYVRAVQPVPQAREGLSEAKSSRVPSAPASLGLMAGAYAAAAGATHLLAVFIYGGGYWGGRLVSIACVALTALVAARVIPANSAPLRGALIGFSVFVLGPAVSAAAWQLVVHDEAYYNGYDWTSFLGELGYLGTVIRAFVVEVWWCVPRLIENPFHFNTLVLMTYIGAGIAVSTVAAQRSGRRSSLASASVA